MEQAGEQESHREMPECQDSCEKAAREESVEESVAEESHREIANLKDSCEKVAREGRRRGRGNKSWEKANLEDGVGEKMPRESGWKQRKC